MIKDPANLRPLTAWNIAGLALFIVGLSFALVAVGTLKTKHTRSGSKDFE